MKPVSGKQMCRALERMGWVLDRIRGSHHIYQLPHKLRFQSRYMETRP